MNIALTAPIDNLYGVAVRVTIADKGSAQRPAIIETGCRKLDDMITRFQLFDGRAGIRDSYH